MPPVSSKVLFCAKKGVQYSILGAKITCRKERSTIYQ